MHCISHMCLLLTWHLTGCWRQISYCFVWLKFVSPVCLGVRVPVCAYVCVCVCVCVYVLRIVSTDKMLCFIYTLIIIIYSLLLRSKFALDRWNGVLYNGSNLWKQGWTVSPHCCQGEYGMYMSKANAKTEDIWIQEPAILLDLSDDMRKLAQSVLSTHWYRKHSKVCDVS